MNPIRKKATFWNHGIIVSVMAEPKTICGYFWKLLIAYALFFVVCFGSVFVVSSALMSGTMLLFAGDVLLQWVNSENLFTNIYSTAGVFLALIIMIGVSSFAVVTLLIGVVVGTKLAFDYLHGLVSDTVKPKKMTKVDREPSLVAEWLKAKKDKVCKRIVWER